MSGSCWRWKKLKKLLDISDCQLVIRPRRHISLHRRLWGRRLHTALIWRHKLTDAYVIAAPSSLPLWLALCLRMSTWSMSSDLIYEQVVLSSATCIRLWLFVLCTEAELLNLRSFLPFSYLKVFVDIFSSDAAIPDLKYDIFNAEVDRYHHDDFVFATTNGVHVFCTNLCSILLLRLHLPVYNPPAHNIHSTCESPSLSVAPKVLLTRLVKLLLRF